jgi:hypothetical protein
MLAGRHPIILNRSSHCNESEQRENPQCAWTALREEDHSWQLIRDEIQCTPKGEIEVKGVHFPVKVYEVKSGVK